MGVICNVHIVNTGAAAYILKWRAWDGRGVWRGCNGGGQAHIFWLTYLQTMITILTSETEREEKSHIEQLN